MSWRYFFGQNVVSHGNFEVSAYEGNRSENTCDRVVEVAHGERLLEAVRYLFQMSFMEIETKNVIDSILNEGGVNDILNTMKYSLMFDYEPVDIDSIASCFAEIHRRNDRFNTIPLFSFKDYSGYLYNLVYEKDSVASNLTKLLVFISQILTDHYGSKDYLNNIEFTHHRQLILVEDISTKCNGFIDGLQNGPVHKMEKEIQNFAFLLVQLEKIIRNQELKTDDKNEIIRKCMKNLSPLFYFNLIPKSETWIKIQDSCFILSEERENWKKRVIWPLGEEIPGYYDEGELSQYSWILDSESKEKEPCLVINKEEYYFGVAQVEEEEERWRDKVSPKKLINYLKYHFQDKEELCKSITCSCSPQKKRLWLCERCLWLVRMFGPTKISCRCRRSTLEKMRIYCNRCKINETKVATDVMKSKDLIRDEPRETSSDKVMNQKTISNNTPKQHSTENIPKEDEDVLKLSSNEINNKSSDPAVKPRIQEHGSNLSQTHKSKTPLLDSLGTKLKNSKNTEQQSKDSKPVALPNVTISEQANKNQRFTDDQNNSTSSKKENTVKNDGESTKPENKITQPLPDEYFTKDKKITILCFLNTAAKILYSIEKSGSSKFIAQLKNSLMTRTEIQNDINIKKEELLQTICCGEKCITQTTKPDGSKSIGFNQVCHNNCNIKNITTGKMSQDTLHDCHVFNEGDICIVCGCSYDVHMHIHPHVQNSRPKQKNLTKVEAETWISNYVMTLEPTKQCINEVLKLGYRYLYQNGNPISDSTFEKQVNAEIKLQESSGEGDQEVINNLKQAIQKHKEIIDSVKRIPHNELVAKPVTDEELVIALNKAFTLPLFGKKMRDIYGSERELAIERDKKGKSSNIFKTSKVEEDNKPTPIEAPKPSTESPITLPSPICFPPSPQEFTVLFLGETGVGKSTLISSLGNYLTWPTFEEAKEHELQVCIPLEFKVQYREADGKIKHNVVKAGETDENENFNNTGQSVTQSPKIYQFTIHGNMIKVIDTPGLADSRGAEQDVKNLEMIRECVHQQDQIHAICIVLKSNDARLRPEFELAVRDYLSLFPKSALKNVFFFFTYASGTFFGIGESAEPVEEIQKKIEDSHEATFFFDSENACAVDSESFKYLLCKERGVKYSDRPENNFVFCWKESASQVRDFLKFIQTVEPIEKETIIAVHHLATTALKLEEFLRTNNEVAKDVLQKLKKESKVIIAAARKHSMVCEYHRLITETKFKSNKKLEDALKKLNDIIKKQKITLPFDISDCENTLRHLPECLNRVSSDTAAERL